MFENVDVQEAIKRSIQTEKNARDFYRLGASHMRHERARKTFELLAREEAEHARMFYDIYTGGDIPDFDAFMAVDPLRDSDWLTDLEKELMEELNVRRAMVLAMDRTPGSCCKLFGKPFPENSPLMQYPGPPIPVPCGHPPWIMNPGMTR